MRGLLFRKASLITLAVGLFVVLVPGMALAQSRADICDGIGTATGGTGCDATSSGSVERVVRTGVQLFSSVVGIAAVIMIIYAGFKYITAGGDSGKISSAQQTIIYALVGLVIAALAQAIVVFVLNEATTTAPNPTP